MTRDDTTVVISGGASGLGLEITRQILERTPGACTVLDLAPAGASELVEHYGEDRAQLIACDVRRPDEVTAAFEAIDGRDRAVSGAVNCAGVAALSESLELTFERWRQVLDVHVDGTFLVSQNAARRMRATGGGSIVNLGSVAMFFGYPGRLPYAAAKAAIGAMTRTLAVEWAPYGIRVNCVAPGYIDTPLMAGAIAASSIDAATYRRLHALDRFGTPLEVANLVLFLLSDQSSFVTGDTIRIDGGFSARKLPDPFPAPAGAATRDHESSEVPASH